MPHSSTSFCNIKYFIQLLQVLHSANEIASSTQRSRIHHPAQLNPSPNAVVSITQRSRIRHPAQSYPSPSAVVSVASMKRINLCNDVHDAKEALLIGARTLLKLRPDVFFAASGRSKCYIGTQFSFSQLAMIPPLSSHLAKKRSLTR